MGQCDRPRDSIGSQRGGVQVKLPSGEAVFVRIKFVVEGGVIRSAEDLVDVAGAKLPKILLRSEDEREDRALDDGELEGSDSLRNVRAPGSWLPTYVRGDQREKQGYHSNEPRMRGIDDVA